MDLLEKKSVFLAAEPPLQPCLILNYISVCMSVCGCVHVSAGSMEDRRVRSTARLQVTHRHGC